MKRGSGCASARAVAPARYITAILMATGILCSFFVYVFTNYFSLLHIVVWHRDLAKMYAVVEQMLKTDNPACRKPFDIPNRMHETPLFLAVQKRCIDAVWYLLEVGANPNYQNRRNERDAPLHYAAARGMSEIVDALCAHTSTNVDLINGMGLTPLICAVRNHGVIEEDSQCLINNKPTIRALLRAGAQVNVAVSLLQLLYLQTCILFYSF
jgi:ankyrin repeat protein